MAKWKHGFRNHERLEQIPTEGPEPSSFLRLDSRFSTSSIHPRACGAHDHPLAVALLEEIHINGSTANVHSVPDPLFGDTPMGHSNIAEHLGVYRPCFIRHESVLAGF